MLLARSPPTEITLNEFERMDAARLQIALDHLRSALVQVAVVLFAALPAQCGSWRFAILFGTFSCFLTDASVFAQTAEIRAIDKDQELVHDLASNSQAFPEVRWDVHNSVARRGVVVVWTINAFEGSGGRQREFADAGLALRIQNAAPARAWRIAQASDQTNVAFGDRSASVSAICSGHGQAAMGLRVTFQTAATPAAGRYRTELVGTMTAP